MFPKGTYLGGIERLDDIRERCNVDDITGCWHWRLNDRKASVRLDGVPTLMPVRRASLILAGRRVTKGQVVFQRDCCFSDDCVNPDHLRAGTRKECSQFKSARGSFDSPERAAILMRYSRAAAKLTPEQRVDVALCPLKARETAEQNGISLSYALRLKREGGSRNQRAASVFDFRP